MYKFGTHLKYVEAQQISNYLSEDSLFYCGLFKWIVVDSSVFDIKFRWMGDKPASDALNIGQQKNAHSDNVLGVNI